MIDSTLFAPMFPPGDFRAFPQAAAAGGAAFPAAPTSRPGAPCERDRAPATAAEPA